MRVRQNPAPWDRVKVLYIESNSSAMLTGKVLSNDPSAAAVKYACSCGNVLPGKHFALGVTLKLLTGSSLVV